MIKELLLATSLLFSISAFSADDKLVCQDSFCQLYLGTEITEPKEYLNLSRALRGLKPGITLYVHLVGNGGSGDGLLYLLNAIKASGAHTIGVFKGSVASTHAVLLLACDEMIIDGEGYIYIHEISTGNMVEDICVGATGKDRGLASYTKCVENITALNAIYAKIIDKYNLKYLTADEQKRYYEGHDIIISTDDFKQRVRK